MAKPDEKLTGEKTQNKDKKDEKAKKEKAPELSDEDTQLKEELDMLVERLTESNSALYKPSLESLRVQIRSSTTSMTSVPKPLKFLRPHYDTLKQVHEKITDQTTKRFCADVISVLGMTMSEGRDCLNYRMLGSLEEIGSWGHEYVRHLTGECAAEWQELEESNDKRRQELNTLIRDIIPFLMSHNAEAEACDLLMEVEKLDYLIQFVDEAAHSRVCLYLKSCVAYTAEPENMLLLRTALAIYRKFNRYPDALLCAIQLNDMDIIKEVFLACQDPMTQKQLAFMLGRQQILLEAEGEVEDYDDLAEIMSNARLNDNFLALARELDIMEPKVPEDIYKSHLNDQKTSLTTVDSARNNLTSSFVNGFVNAGFGKDKLLAEEGNKWLYKNKDHGMMSATATLGLILLWDVDSGLVQIDKYLYSNEDYIKAGALLACGIVSSGVKNDCDPAFALLSDYVLNSTLSIRIGAIVGLGLAYAGSNREDILATLLPVFGDSKTNLEVAGATALACGMVAVGSANGEVTSVILHTLLEKSALELKETHSTYFALGLGLTYLGKQDAVEVVLASLEVVPEPYRSMAHTLVDSCAYAGTGNVLKVQKLLHICSEHYEAKEKESKEKKDDKSKDKKDDKKKDKEESKEEKTEEHVDLSSQQAVAVLGIALIAMGEDIGADMAFRSMGHLLRYGEPVIKRAVPLALALLSASNPRLQFLDTLSKFSHDSDPEVAHNAILAMGIVGAGTNNARLAQMLRQLAVYHQKDANNLFCVRLAQGLTHLGKGTLTLCPYHSDRQILSRVAAAGLLAFLVSCLDVKNTILGKSHYVLFNLVAAMQPRMLVTFDEDLRPLPVSVRVGQAVDVVGQAGKPKTITGFQTHTTPVLLAFGERAELATEEYISYTPLLEGFVILRKNRDYVAEPEADKKK